MDIRISEKYALSIEEAAEYFHIGINKLRSMIKQNPNAKWVLWNGTKSVIKRKLFEQELDSMNVI